jgi:DNA-binding transcriptional MocR family regulator
VRLQERQVTRQGNAHFLRCRASGFVSVPAALVAAIKSTAAGNTVHSSRAMQRLMYNCIGSGSAALTCAARTASGSVSVPAALVAPIRSAAARDTVHSSRAMQTLLYTCTASGSASVCYASDANQSDSCATASEHSSAYCHAAFDYRRDSCGDACYSYVIF